MYRKHILVRSGLKRTGKLPDDRGVIEGMTDNRTTDGYRNGDPHVVLYALMAGAEGCGPAARVARQAQDPELADFLCKVQEEAKRLLVQRVAE